jgi:hypothetical protein
MKSFRFLSNDEDDELLIEPYDGASWIYGATNNLSEYQYDIVEENHFGIHSFLNQFPRGYVACVLSIVGPNGRFHDMFTGYPDGWGFDITSDRINVRWVRFRNETN